MRILGLTVKKILYKLAYA